MALVAPSRAFGQNFIENTSIGMDPLGVYFARGGVNGENMVPITLNTSIDIYQGSYLGELRLHTNTYVRGMFVDRTNAVGPFYDFMENYGMTSSSHASFQEVTVGTHMGDISYDFDEVLSISVDAYASIYRRPGNLVGGASSSVWADGALPLRSTSHVSIFTAGHPDFTYDWQIEMESEWIVTASFHPQPILPAPGSAALLGLGGIIATRRRRA